MATKIQSLAHTKWLCKYHIVFTPKYRRKVIYNQYKNSLREILRRLCEYKNRISSAPAVDVSRIGNEGWVDDFTYNPEFSKPKILSSPIPESVEPNIL